MNIDFHECPRCGGYGVLDNGDNCRECGGQGHGGLSTHGVAGNCIGSGDIMFDTGTGRRVTHAEFAERVRRQAAGPDGPETQEAIQ